MIDPKDKQSTVRDRRGFLKGALVAGGAAAVTQSANANELLTQEQPEEAAKPETTVKYQESDHIKTYYRLARF